MIEVITIPKEARLLVRSLGERSPVLADTELHVFHGATLYVLRERKKVLALDVSYFGKRAPAYENWYIGYVPVTQRQKGYGTRLRKHVDALAVKAGCQRVHSLAGTQNGLLLHAKMGYLIWGLTAQLEVCCDSPLTLEASSVKTAPPWAVKKLYDAEVPISKPISVATLQRRLAGRQLRYEGGERFV